MAGQTRINGNLIDTGTDPEDIVSISAGDARYPKLDGPNTLTGDLTVDGNISGTLNFDNTASGLVDTNVQSAIDTLSRIVLGLPPLVAFPDAAAAYSLRALNATNQSVVRVRRSSDNTEQDFIASEIENGSLTSFVNEQNPLPSTKVADFGSGAAAAYSLRHISDSYSGPVVRVRRSSDNTEQDFTPSEIEDGSLESFCGSGDGLVTTWYDQSGSGNDATQTTASDQPKIVTAGVLVTENGKTAIEFNDDGNLLQKTGGITGNDPNISIFSAGHVFDYRDSGPHFHPIVTQGAPGSADFALFISGGTEDYAQVFTSNSQSVRVESPAPAEVLPVNSNFTLTALGQDNEQHIYTNGSEVSYIGSLPNDQSGFDASGSADFIIGQDLNDRTTFVRMFEIVIYPSFVFSNRVSIETDINSYYQIYEGDNEGHVTTWYDQSGNGNDATQTTASDQPRIVSGGVLVTENGKAALDFDGVDDQMYHPSVFEGTTPRTLIFVGRSKSPASNDVGIWAIDPLISSGDGTTYNITNEIALRVKGYAVYSDDFVDPNNIKLLFHYWNSGSVDNAKFFLDSNELSITASDVTTINTVSTTESVIGRVEYRSDTIEMVLSELIIYPSDQSSNRELIETNINNHYGIY